MKKDRLLRGLVSLQALCMIVVAVVVTSHYVPFLRVKAVEPSEEPGANKGLGGNATVGTIGGRTFTEQELDNELRRRYGEDMLRKMMLREAVQQEAAADGLDITSEQLQLELSRMMDGYESETDYYEAMRTQLGLSRQDIADDARYNLLLEQIAIRNVNVTDEQVDTYINEHEAEFAGETELHLRWILLSTRTTASTILQRLQNGEDFEQLAQSESIDTFTADSGGDLGLIESDDPFIEQALLDTAEALEVGEIGGPIKTEGGYAVIRLDERREHGGLVGDRLVEEASRRVALEHADPLPQVEDALLARYNARSTMP
ncbi:foldase protein PrsA [Paenibacillus cellulosilyticus]|uniref:Foldase protein PrsA n=1 Tax=Paenibacillus cellulosilyticus TaxID=375489 RepID=A0A2V2YQS9_9BACL|nr:peptidylprolyl isomerase [Paenibacillus cellulosilyticus]PWV96015.1 foldase protein PrsA [Paenibacillus cellulosilyticus]QKS48478.1 peptidylprolyl isomerase [Paenibacillus cellulosilyticus]